jgi:hypothetical protein
MLNAQLGLTAEAQRLREDEKKQQKKNLLRGITWIR